MPDIFDRIKYQDLFDRVDFTDVFDRVDLPIEDKVIFSSEIKNLIVDQIIRKIGELPIGRLIASTVKKEVQKKIEKEQNLKSTLENKIEDSFGKAEKEIKETNKGLLEKIKELEEKLKENYKDFNKKLNEPIYEFGGFSPSFNYSNVFYFGDQNTNGSWRIVVDGDNLSVQHKESGAWVEKGSFLP